MPGCPIPKNLAQGFNAPVILGRCIPVNRIPVAARLPAPPTSTGGAGASYLQPRLAGRVLGWVRACGIEFYNIDSGFVGVLAIFFTAGPALWILAPALFWWAAQ